MKDKYYIRLKTYNPLAARYGYFDKGNKAESLFEDAEIKVKIGDKTMGKETVLAKLK